MKMLSKITGVLMILALIVSIGCEGDIERPADYNYQQFKSYLIQNDLDLDDVMDNWVVSAPPAVAVDGYLDYYYVLDLRSPDQFTLGHMRGALNSSLETLLDDVKSHGDKPILLVDETGQVSGHALVALRLSGYTNSHVLRYGMASWNSEFSQGWTDGASNIGLGSQNWVKGNIEPKAQYPAPTWKMDVGTEAEWLKSRVNTMLSLGFKGVEASEALTNPKEYFINTVIDINDLQDVGFLKGTHSHFPITLKNADFRKLDNSSTILTYCWDGCSSSVVTAYLTILGYDAASLEFGVNSMAYSSMTDKKYKVPIADLPVVTD